MAEETKAVYWCRSFVTSFTVEKVTSNNLESYTRLYLVVIWCSNLFPVLVPANKVKD
jgi:hypothetical protein